MSAPHKVRNNMVDDRHLNKQPSSCTLERISDVDSVLNRINPFGRYQILMAFVYSYGYFTLDINNLFMGYGGVEPKWTCSDTNFSTSEPTNNCSIFAKCTNRTFVADFYSIVSEWSLVCDQDYLMDLITSIQMVGVLLGAVMIGPVTDMYGRKWIFFGVLSGEFVFGALSSLSNSAIMFAVFRFIIGWFVGAEMVVGWVFAAESTTNRYRFLSRTMATVFLPMWNQVFIAYVTKNWMWYSISGNLEAVPVLPILALFTYESPRWLAQKGRTNEAIDILGKIAKFNRASDKMPGNIDLEFEHSHSPTHKAKRYFVWHLFTTRRLGTYTVVSVVTWFSIGLAHYGMYFKISELPTNIFVNGAILAGVDMLIIPLGVMDAFNKNISRKYLMIGLFLVTALCNVLVVLLMTVVASGPITDGFLSFSSLLGQVANEACFDVAYVYAIELFPTLLRSNANGLLSMSARLGAVIAPQINYASKHWTPMPYVIYAVISAFGALIDTLFLPNTKNMHLPETYAQSNHLT